MHIAVRGRLDLGDTTEIEPGVTITWRDADTLVIESDIFFTVRGVVAFNAVTYFVCDCAGDEPARGAVDDLVCVRDAGFASLAEYEAFRSNAAHRTPCFTRRGCPSLSHRWKRASRRTTVTMPSRAVRSARCGAPMSAVGFRRMTTRLGAAAKMPFQIHPHMLRHACGFTSNELGLRAADATPR
jgi:hypothetical protein